MWAQKYELHRSLHKTNREALLNLSLCLLYYCFYYYCYLGPTPEELAEMERVETEKRVRCSHFERLWRN